MARMLVIMTVLVAAAIPLARTEARGAPQVVVFPAAGHPGDRFYVSGSGYPARYRLAVLLACPTIGSPLYGSQSFSGPSTDKHGQFVGFSFRAFAPRKPGRCRLYAGPAGHSLAHVPSVSYTVLPHAASLPRCAATMCLHLRAEVVRLRAGAQGSIQVQGWPGATVTITISDSSGPTLHRSIHLGWHGVASTKLIVAPGLQRALKQRINIRAQLGKISGVATGHFIVLPLGR